MRTGDTDFMRIRRYVVDRIATSGDQPIRFPATRELARQFGVSQPTALRAIQSLIEEGYLIACKSGGTISRPATLGYSENLKIFGLVEYQGKQVFDTLYFNLISHAASYELLRRSETNKTKQLILETPSQLERTAREENLSGVILLGSEPHMAEYAHHLRENGTPVASFMHRFDGISSFYNPIQDQIRQTLTDLFREGRTHVLIPGWPERPDLSNPVLTGIQEACTEQNIPRGQVIFLDRSPDVMEEKVEEMLNFGMRFDAVVFINFQRRTYNLLLKFFNPEETVFLIDSSSLYDDLNFTGRVFSYDLADAAHRLVDDLFEQMNQPDRPPVHEKIAFRQIRYRNGIPE